MVTLLGSGSGLFRSLECPASVHLPHTPKQPHVVRAGERGSAIHEYLQHAPEEGPAALARVPEKYRGICSKIDVQDAAGTYTQPHLREIAFAHHGETGDVRHLPCEGGARDYGTLVPHETPLTLDVVVAGYRTAEVWDYKTGRTPVPSPEVNPQLLHGALCVAETVAPRASRFVLGIQTITSDGGIHSNAAVVDRFDLEAHEGRIRLAQRKALRVVQAIEAGETPEVNPGPWCRYCDAERACPK